MDWEKLIEANRLSDKIGELNKCINLDTPSFNHHVFNLKNFSLGVDEETVTEIKKVFENRIADLNKEFEDL